MEKLEKEVEIPVPQVVRRMREDPKFRDRVRKNYRRPTLTTEERKQKETRIYRLNELTSNYGSNNL